jgi:hypothetical protein
VETQPVLETVVSLNQLTLLSKGEGFIEFSPRESFKTDSRAFR